MPKLCQDLEEERIDFVRNALWSYVNTVSLICVKDDEVDHSPTSHPQGTYFVTELANMAFCDGQSCENVRQVVETCDVRRDMLGFIRREGGGNIIQGALSSFLST